MTLPARSVGALTVSAIGLGCMNLSHAYGVPPSDADGIALLNRALDLGVTLLDTAALYGLGANERLVGKAVMHRRAEFTLASKCVLDAVDGKRVLDGRPESIRRTLEGALERLGTDHIDLYYLHRLDKKVPVEESVGELARLRTEGKIRHVGVSNFSVDELQRVRRIVPIVSVQNRYNVGDRGSEDVLALCTREGIAFIPWAPIASGSAEKLVSDGLEAVAKQHGVSVFQVALAWLLAKSPVMLPIPGTSSVAHLEDNVGAAGLELSAQDLARLG